MSTLNQQPAEPVRPSWLKGPPPLPRRPPETLRNAAPALPPLAPFTSATSAPKALPDQDAPPLPAPPPPPPPHFTPLPESRGPPGRESANQPDRSSSSARLPAEPGSLSTVFPPPPPLQRPSGAYAALSDAYLGAPGNARGPHASTAEQQPPTAGAGPRLEASGEAPRSGPFQPDVQSRGNGRASPSTLGDPAFGPIPHGLQESGPGPVRGSVPTLTDNGFSGAPRASIDMEKALPPQKPGDTPPSPGDLDVIINGVSVFGRDLQTPSSSPGVTASSSYAALSDSYLGAGGTTDGFRQATGDSPGPESLGGGVTDGSNARSSQQQVTRDGVVMRASPYAALSDSYLQPAPARPPETEAHVPGDGSSRGGLWSSAFGRPAKEPLFRRVSRDASPGAAASKGKASSGYAALSDSYLEAPAIGGAPIRADAAAAGGPLPAAGVPGARAADRAAWARVATPAAPIAVPAVWTPLRGTPLNGAPPGAPPSSMGEPAPAENGGPDAHSLGAEIMNSPFRAVGNGTVGQKEESFRGTGAEEESGQKPPRPGHRVAQPPPKEPGGWPGQHFGFWRRVWFLRVHAIFTLATGSVA